jgi:RHS repeat-associated protein
MARAMAWGLDISGSPQGAGGAGGLLFMADTHNGAPTAGRYVFFHYDGNGNVASSRWVDGAVEQLHTAIEYGPFGETLTVDGEAKDNPFRFSTKYMDAESGLYYYGFRYYNASTGRWLSRDPTEEGDGPNVYAFVGNCASQHVDALGMESHRAVDVSNRSGASSNTTWEASTTNL